MQRLPITTAIDLLREHEVEDVPLQRGEATAILTLAGDGFQVLIQRPGQPDERLKLDEFELLTWWMEWEG
jgi:hypothetical protein